MYVLLIYGEVDKLDGKYFENSTLVVNTLNIWLLKANPKPLFYLTRLF